MPSRRDKRLNFCWCKVNFLLFRDRYVPVPDGFSTRYFRYKCVYREYFSYTFFQRHKPQRRYQVNCPISGKKFQCRSMAMNDKENLRLTWPYHVTLYRPTILINVQNCIQAESIFYNSTKIFNLPNVRPIYHQHSCE